MERQQLSMSKKNTIHLADIYPGWIYFFAISVPILFGMSAFNINFRWAYMTGGAALTIILILYTAVKLCHLFELRLIGERQRYGDDQRNRDYHFHHGFGGSVENIRNIFNLRLDEYRKDNREQMDDINRTIGGERDNLRKTIRHMLNNSQNALNRHSAQNLVNTKNQLDYHLDVIINKAVHKLDEKIKISTVILKGLKTNKVLHEEYRELKLQLRHEFERALRLTTISLINKIGRNSEKSTQEIFKKIKQQLLTEKEKLFEKSNKQREEREKISREDISRIIKNIEHNQWRKIDNLHHKYSKKLDDIERHLRIKYLTVNTETWGLENKAIESLKGITTKQSNALKEELSARIMAIEIKHRKTLDDLRKETSKSIQESGRHNHDAILNAVKRVRAQHK